ncbi:hypothetical protein ACF06Q_26120 [Streptomyces leeuwenhoekii]|uniref:hypothetical protein n=1 Tax=Streptomyces leeuwenhoekii TaxID=1437453 RepID=UPI0036FC3AA8
MSTPQPKLTAAVFLYEDSLPVTYLFQGTWAARYTRSGNDWKIDAPFSVPHHLTVFWPGLTFTTAGHQRQDAFFEPTAGNLWITRDGKLIRYNRATKKAAAPVDLKSQLAVDTHFEKGVDAALNTPELVTLFRGNQYCTFTAKGAVKQKKTALPTGITHVDAACFVPTADKKGGTAYLFTGGTYRTCSLSTTDGKLTLTGSEPTPIGRTWPRAPLTPPHLDIYVTGYSETFRISTNIDISDRDAPLPRKTWVSYHEMSGFMASRGVFTPDGAHVYDADYDILRYFDLPVDEAEEEAKQKWAYKPSGEKFDKPLNAPDWKSLWFSRNGGTDAGRIETDHGAKPSTHHKAPTIFPSPSKCRFSPSGDLLYCAETFYMETKSRVHAFDIKQNKVTATSDKFDDTYPALACDDGTWVYAAGSKAVHKCAASAPKAVSEVRKWSTERFYWPATATPDGRIVAVLKTGDSQNDAEVGIFDPATNILDTVKFSQCSIPHDTYSRIAVDPNGKLAFCILESISKSIVEIAMIDLKVRKVRRLRLPVAKREYSAVNTVLPRWD